MSENLNNVVVILGHGVSGITCAYQLLHHLRNNPHLHWVVQLWGDGLGIQPYNATWDRIPYGVDNLERCIQWSNVSASVLWKIAEQVPVEEAGVFKSVRINASTKPIVNSGEIPAKFTSASSHESAVFDDQYVHSTLVLEERKEAFRLLNTARYKDYESYRAPLLETRRYLPWLMQQAISLGGQIRKIKVESFVEIYNSLKHEYSNVVVVNCTGLGAIALTEDKNLEPARGQIILLRLPESSPPLRSCPFDHTEDGITYVIPDSQGKLIECGGTHIVGEWSRTPNPQTSAEIWERCAALVPELKHAEHVDTYVCLRPKRRGGPRVELEWFPVEMGCLERKTFAVVHNYGHGGSGYNLSWGIAQEVVKLVSKAVEQLQKSPGTMSAKL